MDGKMIDLTGYHGTCSNCIESIEKHGLDPDQVKYREDHWLGQGVYFFENWDKAMWWAEDISRKNRNRGSFPVIYQAALSAKESEVLDLDDEKVVDQFYSRILNVQAEIEADARGRYPVFDEQKLRAVYFDYYKREYGISIIICTFSKPCTKSGVYRNREDLKKQLRLVQALGVSYKEKQICVSEKECIGNTVMVYNGEDEVV